MEENFCKECSLSYIKAKKKEKTISDKTKNIEKNKDNEPEIGQ